MKQDSKEIKKNKIINYKKKDKFKTNKDLNGAKTKSKSIDKNKINRNIFIDNFNHLKDKSLIHIIKNMIYILNIFFKIKQKIIYIMNAAKKGINVLEK